VSSSVSTTFQTSASVTSSSDADEPSSSYAGYGPMPTDVKRGEMEKEKDEDGVNKGLVSRPHVVVEE
jgi:hypothetical protein